MTLSEAGTGNDPGEPLITSSRWDYSPQYSPDGQRIVFESDRSGKMGIWVCDADGKNAAAVFLPEKGRAGTPSWSPDGALIAFDSKHEGQWDVYLILADGGTPMALTRDGADDYIPSWSRDGKWVYFASVRSGRSEVWKSSADGSETVQVTRNGGHVAFESADSNFVYYDKPPGPARSLWRVPVTGGSEEKSFDTVWKRSFAATERGVYFVMPPAEDDSFFSLRRLDPDTDEVEMVVPLDVVPEDPRDRLVQGLTVSPDHRSILYMRGRETSDLMFVENFR